MPLYFLNDPGSPMYRAADEKVWNFVQTRNDVQPNASLAAGDVVNLTASNTMNEADGAGRQQYTAAQRGIGVWKYGQYITLPNNTVDWTVLWASAPVSGAIRWYGDYTSTIRINGVYTVYQPNFGWFGGGAGDVDRWARDNFNNAKTVSVLAGDLVEIKNGDANFRGLSVGLIPFTY